MRKRIKTIGCLILVLTMIYAQQAMPSYAGDKAVGKITIRREGEAIGSESEPSPEPSPEPTPRTNAGNADADTTGADYQI